MRFGTHIRLYDAVSSDDYEEFVRNLGVMDKLEIMTARDEVYPLPKSPDPERVKKMSEKYNLYTNILSMKLGQFIMLESQIRSKNTRDEIIASLVIRPKDEMEYDNEDHEKEERILSEIMEEQLLDVHSVISTMMLNREYILFTKFSGVIYNRVEKDEEEEDLEEENDGKIGDDEFNSQWFWYRIVRDLAQEDIRRFNDIYDLKMSVVMVELSFLAQRAILENARTRAEEARHKALLRR
jgi:hypothetical protein